MNTVTLGPYPVYQPDRDLSCAYNFFEARAGACNVGRGRLLMRRADVEQLMAQSTPIVSLSFTSGPGKSNTVSIPVVPWEAVTLKHDLSAGGGSKAKDLVLLTVFDARAVNSAAMAWKRYNVQMYGFPYYSDGVGIFPLYFPGTLRSGSEWTWAQLVADLATSPPTSPVIAVDASLFTDPGWKPRNLVWSGSSLEYALDEVCAKTFNLAAYDWDQNKHVLYPYGTASSANQKIASYPLFQQANVSPGDILRNSNAICPKKVYVVYPTSQWEPNGNVNIDTSGPPTNTAIPFPTIGVLGFPRTYNSRHGAVIVLHVRDYVSPKENGYPSYGDTAFLTAANDIADRYTTELARIRADDTYAGIWAVKPDGMWRSILWSFGRGGAFTRIRTNDGASFLPDDDAPQAPLYRSMGTNGTNDGPRDYAGYSRSVKTERPGVVSVYITDTLPDPLPGTPADATKTGQKGYYKGYIMDSGPVTFPPASYDLFHDAAAALANGVLQECVVCNLLEANQNAQGRSFTNADSNRAVTVTGQIAFGKIVGWTGAAGAGAGQSGIKPIVHCHYLAPKGGNSQTYIKDVSISAGAQTLTKTTGTLTITDYGEIEGFG